VTVSHAVHAAVIVKAKKLIKLLSSSSDGKLKRKKW